MDYVTFARIATGDPRFEPYPYQQRLAKEPWPTVLEVPTGLGKTLAVGLAWLYRRFVLDDRETPRRLLYCLPMRTLVEQTGEAFEGWIHNLVGADALAEEVPLYRLMGGEDDVRHPEWAAAPERSAVFVGTQDMMLSRALMRGYGMSRFQWPVHFALLHNDAMWVYDEVQLMGAGLPTSAQLEGLRRQLEPAKPCRSLWVSATLRPQWLRTVDFAPYLDEAPVARLDDADHAIAEVGQRMGATKPLERTAFSLDGVTASALERYVDSLADAVLQAHGTGQTLLIVNRVDRAQKIAARLQEKGAGSVLLAHSRFRPAEREYLNRELRHGDSEGRIVVATQAVEAGVDISSQTLFTELAPWPSLIQRFGRCNRDGRCADARVYWIDLAEQSDAALPYEPQELVYARARLRGLADVGPHALPALEEEAPLHAVLRRRDLLQLFNTEPDLFGYDIDVAAFVRDRDDTDVQVFWRHIDENAVQEQPRPERRELCNVSLAQLHAYAKKRVQKKERWMWRWDPLGDRWAATAEARDIRPGMTLMLDARLGGYDMALGFDAGSVSGVEPLEAEAQRSEAHDAESTSYLGRAVTLDTHLRDVHGAALTLSAALGVEDEAVALAALWHDVGKAHPAFQYMLVGEDENPSAPLAKSASSSRRSYAVRDGEGNLKSRPNFRHELASALAWLHHNPEHERRDLVAYLIAAHHGRVRTGLRALPGEAEPPGRERLFARGVWDGEELPSMEVNGVRYGPTPLHLDVMEIGGGNTGRSWADRTARLLHEVGPFHLAWLEALVRVADWRASERESKETAR